MTRKEYDKWLKDYLDKLFNYCRKECSVDKKNSGDTCLSCTYHNKQIIANQRGMIEDDL